MPDEKKLIIDEDWKEEAQREKEELAKAVESAKEKKELPPPSLAMLLSDLAMQALLGLGDIPHPATGKPEPNLDEAKFHIDLLEILEQKTKGNLDPEEQRLFDGLLYDLRMRYVEANKRSPGA